MSRDSDNSFGKSKLYFDFTNFDVHSKEQIYHLTMASPSNVAEITEKETTAESHDGQTYFYADSKSCDVQSNDPNDLYRALDITFQKNPSILSKVFTVFSSILRNSSGGTDGKVFVNNDERKISNRGSKPKM